MAGPGTAGPSRLRLATDAARQGMSYYPDSTEVGVWLFPGPRPDQAVQPVAPLTALGLTRSLLGPRLASVQPVPGGGTPLYAATLKAVRALSTGWDPRKVRNAVVLLSDGHDTGGGPGLDQLLTDLRECEPRVDRCRSSPSDWARRPTPRRWQRSARRPAVSSYRAGSGTSVR